MPHSTASDPVHPECLIEEDSILPAPPEQILDTTRKEGRMDTINGASQLDATVEAPTTDVRLEDLFNDINDDEDDEFAGLGDSNTSNESSTSEAPL